MKARVRIALVVTALLVGTAGATWIGPKLLRKVSMQGLKAVTVADGLDHPWALAFLPDGRMLVTERPGRMRLVTPDGRLSAPLAGLPPVLARDEGGLLDVAIDPDFKTNGLVYWTYAEPEAAPADPGKPRSGTAIARGRLQGEALVDVQVIYRQPHTGDTTQHYGSRLLFARDGTLFVGLGDRGRRDDSQKLDSPHGKVLHIDTQGRPVPGNPFAGQPGALPEVWSYGHRNIQGLAWHPRTGELWAMEHGPRGGDEINLVRRGLNYGWPVITYGCEYKDCAKIGEGTAKAGMEQPVGWWGEKSIVPTGMAILGGSERYPGWQGQYFVGSMRRLALMRLKVENGAIVEQQELLTALAEPIRDVVEGPDGWLYVTTARPQGRIIRVEVQ